LTSYHFIFTYHYIKKTSRQGFLSPGEFVHAAAAEIFNPYAALQVWAGTPDSI